ncbi:hypothetical protein BJ742DRAFT_305294 [Cladochytrium replicatum]|nr:hypothetical protein BJ742DRAFT_305294 [Cladochytrium replicatum]
MAFESESDTDHPASTHRPTATASKTKSKTDQPTAESVFAETTSIEVRSPTRKRFTAESDHDDRRRQRKEGIHYSSEETPTTAETGASASKIALPRLKTVPRKLKKLQLPSHPVPIRPAPSRQRTLLLNADIANPDSSTPATYSVRTPTIPTVPLPAPTYHTIASPTYTGQPVTIIPGLSTALAAIQHNVYERRPIRDEFVSSRVVTDPSSPKNDEDQATEPRSNFYTLFQDQPGNLLVRSNFHSEPKITRIILRPYTQAVTSFSPVDAFVSDGISRLTEVQYHIS